MAIRFIVTVCDYNLKDVFFKTVRQRRFRRLDQARRYEAKFYRKAMRKPDARGTIERFGAVVNNQRAVVNNGFAWNPYRTITITAKDV